VVVSVEGISSTVGWDGRDVISSVSTATGVVSGTPVSEIVSTLLLTTGVIAAAAAAAVVVTLIGVEVFDVASSLVVVTEGDADSVRRGV
jgi:hypothetical protein